MLPSEVDLRHQSYAPASPAWVTEDLIEATLRVWQPYYDEPLTREEAIEMILAASRLFALVSREASGR